MLILSKSFYSFWGTNAKTLKFLIKKKKKKKNNKQKLAYKFQPILKLKTFPTKTLFIELGEFLIPP